MGWHVRLNGTDEGPISEEQFREYVRDGRINARTLVWKPGMDTWIDYGTFENPAPPPLPSSVEASVGERVTALAVDIIIAYLITRSVFWVKEMQYPWLNGLSVSLAMSMVVTVVPWMFFMAYCTSFHGGTPGKLALRLCVATSRGSGVPFFQACVRELVRLYAPVKLVGLFFYVADRFAADGVFRLFGLFYSPNFLITVIVFFPALLLTVAHTIVFARDQRGFHDVLLRTHSVRIG